MRNLHKDERDEIESEIIAISYDNNRNVIEAGKCKCGKQADTCIMGNETYMWICNNCLYPVKAEEAKLTYVEWGGGWPEEFKNRMEERMEKAKKILGQEVKPRKCDRSR